MYKRHDLIRLSPAGWEQALAGLSGAAADLAADWRARDLPAVVRRLEPGMPADTVCLGMPAPPDPHTGQKRRAGVAVSYVGIASTRAPLALHEAEVPARWQQSFTELRASLEDASIDCRVFGSLAMQTLTGDAYLSPTSDIDLLLRPIDAAQLEAGLLVLARHARALPLDGEIEFPDGHAVSWKEWLGVNAQGFNGGDRVLAKHIDAVALVRRDALLAQFEGAIHG